MQKKTIIMIVKNGKMILLSHMVFIATTTFNICHHREKTILREEKKKEIEMPPQRKQMLQYYINPKNPRDFFNKFIYLFLHRVRGEGGNQAQDSVLNFEGLYQLSQLIPLQKRIIFFNKFILSHLTLKLHAYQKVLQLRQVHWCL